MSTETFPVYSVAHGQMKERLAIKETATGYRLDNGQLVAKEMRSGDMLWRRAGKGYRSASCRCINTPDKQAAIEHAKQQTKEYREYIETLLAEAIELEKQAEALS